MASSQKLHDVGSTNDLPPGQMKEVKVEGKKVLLANVVGEICAIAGECPHYGMSLAEGILCGRRVVCPWHKAIFDVKSGALLEPPALDALPPYEVVVRDQRVYLRPPSGQIQQTTKLTPPNKPECFVLLGAGAAAAAAAENLRALGFAGRIVMVNPEQEPPYDRTKVSKEYLSAKASAEELWLRPPEFWEEQHVEIVTNAATDVDPTNRQITLSDGSFLHYDKLLLASGARPKPIEVVGARLGNVFLLRSHGDADQILQQAKAAKRTVVIGGSFIAMEAASCLKTQDLQVTVIVSEQRPFAKQLGPEVGAILQQHHERKGVMFELGADIERFEGDHSVSLVRLKSGKTIPADLVVIGVGVEPVTDYAATLSRGKDGGILVDATLQAAENIYAVGDITIFPESYSGGSVRIEHWRVAQQQGRLAAQNMLGAAKPFDGVPYFWTNHFDMRFDYVGHAEKWDEVKLIQDEKDFPTFLALYLKAGRIIAAAGCQRDLEICTIHEAMRLNRMPLAEHIQPDIVTAIRSIDLSDTAAVYK